MKSTSATVQRKKHHVPVTARVHEELKVASFHRGEQIMQLVTRAWTAFKAQEGKRLHKPVADTEQVNAA